MIRRPLTVAFLTVTLASVGSIGAIAIVAALPARAADESAPPEFLDERIDAPPTLASDPVRALSLGDFVAKFEKTTLGQILDVTHVGTIRHAGDAGGSQYWLCYSLPNQRLWLISHGEMGGPTHQLTQVVAEATTPASKSSADCPTLPERFRSLSLSFGWIGTDQATLLHALGTPSGNDHEWLLFFYLGKERGPYTSLEDGHEMIVDYDVSAFVAVLVQGGKVAKLSASHVTSY